MKNKDNYIVLGGKRVELTEEQARELRAGFDLSEKRLCEVRAGDTFKVWDLEFICLEHREEGTAVLLKDLWKVDKFDNKSNDYSKSSIREELNTVFAERLKEAVGGENIVTRFVSLTSDDGREDYEWCTDEVGLMTCDDYRKYVYILDEYRPEKCWWLATPYSTASNGYDLFVSVVSDGGSLDFNSCYLEYGVRPFCILKSDIFVS